MNARYIVIVIATGAAAMTGVLGASAAHSASATRSLPYYSDASLTPHWPVSESERAKSHRVGNFRLTDGMGRPVTRRSVEGRIYVASFFYSECRTLCPDLRAQLARVRDAFSGDSSVLILSHSVMPERDDPARLAHYAVRNGIDGNHWKLLTGAREELERLARDAYFVELADTTGNTRGALRHTETLVLVDKEGYIRGVYDGSLAYDVTQLIADIRELNGGNVETNQ